MSELSGKKVFKHIKIESMEKYCDFLFSKVMNFIGIKPFSFALTVLMLLKSNNKT